MSRTVLLGIDHGTVRIGLAVSDADRKFSFPLETYARRNTALDVAFFRDLVERERVGMLVIGLPVHADGRESDQSAAVRKFGAWLSGVVSLPVAFYDERYTSVMAEGALWQAGLTHKQRKERIDKVAAQMLLQAYIEAGCPAEATPGALGE